LPRDPIPLHAQERNASYLELPNLAVRDDSTIRTLAGKKVTRQPVTGKIFLHPCFQAVKRGNANKLASPLDLRVAAGLSLLTTP